MTAMMERSTPERRGSAAPGVRVVASYPCGGVGVLTVSGEIDLREADPLRSAVVAVFGRCRYLVVDLSGVTFLGSTGLRELVRAHRVALATRGQMRVVTGRGNRRVRRPIEVSELVGYLHVHHTVEDAVAALPVPWTSG